MLYWRPYQEFHTDNIFSYFGSADLATAYTSNQMKESSKYMEKYMD